jgi:mitogen-activated protein kinase 15
MTECSTLQLSSPILPHVLKYDLCNGIGGQPMFPGKSTMNQLERIIEVTGRPSKADMTAIRSKFTTTMLDSLNIKPQKALNALFPAASTEALDLLRKLLQFNPEKRLDSAAALRHPYLAQFHNPDDEPVLSRPITISMDDNKRSSISAYRKYLYKKIVQRKKELAGGKPKSSPSTASASGASATGSASTAGTSGSGTTSGSPTVPATSSTASGGASKSLSASGGSTASSASPPSTGSSTSGKK